MATEQKQEAKPPATRDNSVLVRLGEHYKMDPIVFHNTIMRTIMPSNAKPTQEQVVSFLMVAEQYKLNPLTKEIYAFPGKGGGIQPIVSIDGWVNLINSHPAMNGIVLDENMHDGKVVSITCKIYRKDRDHPIIVTEYMEECKRPTEPWNKWPIRMLRHKALIQCARVAFGFAGIIDPDEYDRMKEVKEVDVQFTKTNVSKDINDAIEAEFEDKAQVGVENDPSAEDETQENIDPATGEPYENE